MNKEQYIDKQPRVKIFIEKCNFKMQMESVKRMRATKNKNNKDYGIKKDDPITFDHVFALILYSQCTKLCTAFRFTYRRLENESTEEYKKRHSLYANMGRLLFESFLFFASTNSKVSVLYHGMSVELLFKNLECKFIAPTSTTSEVSVACNFGRQGVVMKLESAESNKFIKAIDMSLISCFDNESEYFIFDYKLRIIDLFIPRLGCWIGKSIMNRLLLLDLLSNNIFVDNEQLLKPKNQAGLVKILRCIATDSMSTFTKQKYVNELIGSLITQKNTIIFNMKNAQSLESELCSLFTTQMRSEESPFEITLQNDQIYLCKLRRKRVGNEQVYEKKQLDEWGTSQNEEKEDIVDTTSSKDEIDNQIDDENEPNGLGVIKEEIDDEIDVKLEDLLKNEIGCLGIGAFSRVTLVENPVNKRAFALKKMRKNQVVETSQQEHILNEKKIMAALDNPFCVKLFATFKDELNVYFLMEPVMGGELFSLLRHTKTFKQLTAAFYCGCVVLAFEYLHTELNVIYRDVKPENLMIASNGYIKLVDFGFAKVRNNTCTLCGTPQYLAPEVIRNYSHGFEVDWWGLGILLYEMIFGYPPFEADKNMKMYEKILTAPVEFPETESKLKPATKDIIQSLLVKEAHKRLGSGPKGAFNVKKHNFFRKLDWDRLSKQQIDPPWKPTIKSSHDLSAFDRFPDIEEEDEKLMDDFDGSIFAWCEEF